MNFENVNPLNVRLNKLSGNLLPMTDDGSLFSTAWRIYGAILWIIEVIQTSAIIPGIMYVPREKAMRDATVGLVVTIEILFFVMRMNANKDLVSRLIRQLNSIMRVEDETMKNVISSTIKTVELPLKFYWIAGTIAITIWCFIPYAVVFKKRQFLYEDYRVPVAFSKQPFSMSVFLLGSIFGTIASVYIFTKKVAMDVWTINIVLLMTAQYRYTSIKLTMIFREKTSHDDESTKKRCSTIDSWAEAEMRALCRHYNLIIHMTLILKKLLSLNLSLIYLNNVFRFCFIGIMLIIALPSTTFLEGLMVFMYMCGGLVQLYILCLCMHQLLEASTEMTDKAFHEKWYLFGPSLKRTFLLMILANNLECKLSTFEKYNLSLPSFMTILNQAYSVALLFLRIK